MKVKEAPHKEESHRPSDETGGGEALEQLLSSLRLHLSHVTGATKELAKDWMSRQPSDLTDMQRDTIRRCFGTALKISGDCPSDPIALCPP